MEDDTLANAITYILLLRVKSFPKMYVTLCPPKWYHSPPLAHALSYTFNNSTIRWTRRCGASSKVHVKAWLKPLQPLQMSQTQHATPTPQLPLPVGWSSIGTLNLLRSPKKIVQSRGGWLLHGMLSLNYLVLAQ